MMEMQRLSDTKATTSYWIRPRWGKPIYELRSEKELFSTLRWFTHVGQDPALFVSADGQWKLTTEWGPWWTRALYITNLDGDVAVCRQENRLSLTRSFSVEFTNGRRFCWRTNFWYTRGVFSGEDNEDLIVLKLVRIPQLKIQVDLVHGLEDFPQASLLAALGLYIFFATAWRGSFGWFGW
jgi:hypothetical protein